MLLQLGLVAAALAAPRHPPESVPARPGPRPAYIPLGLAGTITPPLGKVHANCSLDKAVPAETCEITGLPLIGDIGLGVKANVTALSLEAYIVYRGKDYKIYGLNARNPQICESIEGIKVSQIDPLSRLGLCQPCTLTATCRSSIPGHSMAVVRAL